MEKTVFHNQSLVTNVKLLLLPDKSSIQERIKMATSAFEDVTADWIAGKAHPIPTGRSVFNYIGQLHHTPNHRRPGQIAPNCTSPEGVTRVRQAYNQLVQAYRTHLVRPGRHRG